jgi:serine carboxypeptidase
VNGTGIPEVNFNIGESYAGLIPTSPTNKTSLYFWFFPTTNPAGKDDLVIWLNVSNSRLTYANSSNFHREVQAAVLWKDFCKKTAHFYGTSEPSNPFRIPGHG